MSNKAAYVTKVKHLQGQDLLDRRFSGTLTVSFEANGIEVSRAVTSDDVWDDLDIMRDFALGLTEQVNELVGPNGKFIAALRRDDGQEE